ncbi:unnamed protein product [Vitrella brassicaformis CCMP3155]|uniref:TRP C-terminal domain-containing protein n=2 Tax=Vitrella brassicaformis TaxID=1169539 RepID=A0A0G4EPW6_VITBC|nr:unnamed protein product [Vitrella brassicaformis CCMP3155]|eukprot:CEL99320.1 unnamed protein product [Vitrella brassicaformis CCMP3155]
MIAFHLCFALVRIYASEIPQRPASEDHHQAARRCLAHFLSMEPPPPASWDKTNDAIFKMMRRYIDLFTYLLVHMVNPACVVVVSQMLHCVAIKSSDGSVARRYFYAGSHTCAPEGLIFVVLGIPVSILAVMFLLIVFPFALCLHLFFTPRLPILEDSFRSLELSYKEEYRWWDVTLVFRRLFLLSGAVLIIDPLVRARFLFAGCLVVLLVHLLVRPFRYWFDDAMESITLANLVIVSGGSACVLSAWHEADVDVDAEGKIYGVNPSPSWSQFLGFLLLLPIIPWCGYAWMNVEVFLQRVAKLLGLGKSQDAGGRPVTSPSPAPSSQGSLSHIHSSILESLSHPRRRTDAAQHMAIEPLLPPPAPSPPAAAAAPPDSGDDDMRRWRARRLSRTGREDDVSAGQSRRGSRSSPLPPDHDAPPDSRAGEDRQGG